MLDGSVLWKDFLKDIQDNHGVRRIAYRIGAGRNALELDCLHKGDEYVRLQPHDPHGRVSRAIRRSICDQLGIRGQYYPDDS